MTMTPNNPSVPPAYLQYLQSLDISPLTVQGYLRDVRRFLAWLMQQTASADPLAGFTQQAVREYRQALLNDGAAAATINRKLAALAHFGSWAAGAGLVAQNPAQSIHNVEQARLAPKWLDRRQRQALLRAVEKDIAQSRRQYPRLWVLRLRDGAIVVTLLFTGLRASELCALRLDDLQLSERKGILVVRSGKGGKRRQLPLNQPARQALATWLENRPACSHEYLFTGQRGEPANNDLVQRAVRRLALEAGLNGVTPHTLRHSFAKSLIDAGVGLEKAAALLGHSNLNTTLIYTIPGLSDLTNAVEQLED